MDYFISHHYFFGKTDCLFSRFRRENGEVVAMSTVSSGGKLKELSSSVHLFTRLAYFKMFLLRTALNLVWSLRFHHPVFSFDQNSGLLFTSFALLGSRDPVPFQTRSVIGELKQQTTH